MSGLAKDRCEGGCADTVQDGRIRGACERASWVRLSTQADVLDRPILDAKRVRPPHRSGCLERAVDIAASVTCVSWTVTRRDPHHQTVHLLWVMTTHPSMRNP